MSGVFQRPFPPLAEKSHRLRSAFLIAFFVFGFLYLFKPFGLSEVQGGLLLVTALYGLITLIILLLTQLLFPILFKQYYKEQKWTVGKEIFQSMANVLLIAIGNFLLSCYLGFFPWSVDTFLLFVGFTFAIGIIPVTIQALVRQNIYHRRNARAVIDDNRAIAERQKHSTSASIVSISREDGEEAFQAEAEDILAIESSGNYIEVHRSEGKPVLIRKSLSATQRGLPEEFFRTHRSWIVNLPLVNHVEGNARGYVLSFENASIEVPVSRSKLGDFDTKLKALSKG
ncbi:MAG TPA: LytTR family DNA-binding domain-containing protein [Cryomorphaceae bacterium]|nr:LytTR family DNA-binding domain-containing protein [Cryomorphaceae bacterium]